MQASFDQSTNISGKKFAVVAWKNGRVVAWTHFGPKIKEPLFARFDNLVQQALKWMSDIEFREDERFNACAVESFVDYKDRFKNRSLAQLDQFTGYLTHALSTRNPHSTTPVIAVSKGVESKRIAWAAFKKHMPDAKLTKDEKDAVVHGCLANFCIGNERWRKMLRARMSE